MLLPIKTKIQVSKKKIGILYPIGAFIIGCLLLAMVFGDVMVRPNSFVSEAGGDGLKNHYAFAHYIKNDKGFHFSGMNYPYGEHIFYPDQQPILSTTLSFIHRNITPIDDYSIGISNIFMLYSVGFCALFLFLILRKFKLPPWYSLIMAGLIAALSPQIYRFVAHQALGYTVYLPLLWYLLLSYEDRRQKWLWSIGIVLTILVFGGLHLYYLPLGAFFILAYLGITFLVNIRNLRPVIKRLLSLLAMAILPILTMQVLISATDPMLATRVQNPWGFFHYVARFESIFIPYYTPFQEILGYFIKLPNIQFEGYGAIGVIGSLVFIALVIRSIRFLIQRHPQRLLRFTSTPRLNHYIWASVLLLLFSMAVPFVWGMDWILDIVPRIKQFRSVGRFNWAFYYVFSVFAAYYVFLLYKRLRQKRLYGFAYPFLAAVILLWFANDYAFLKHVRTYNKSAFQANLFHQDAPPYLDALKAAGFQAKDYQAMLGLPYYHKGSEKVGVMGSTLTFDKATFHAYNIGLPLLNSYLARAPIDQATNVAQLLGDTLLEKAALKDFPNDKPILVGFYDNPNQPLTAVEQSLIRKSKHIASYENFHFYTMPLSAFEASKKPLIERFENKTELYDYKSNGQKFMVSDTAMSFFYFDDFENGNAENTFTGKKSKAISDGSELELYNGKIDLDSGEVLTVTVWIECDYRQALANFYHQVIDEKGEVVGLGNSNGSASLNYFNGWLRISYDLNAEPSIYTHRLMLKNPKYITADALLIQPKGSDVFWQPNEKILMYNNLPLKWEK